MGEMRPDQRIGHLGRARSPSHGMGVGRAAVGLSDGAGLAVKPGLGTC